MSVTQKNRSKPYPHLIDCDVHQAVDGRGVGEYLPQPWRRTGLPGGMTWPSAEGHSVLRRDAIPPGGGEPGSDPQFLLEHLVEAYEMDYAILTGGVNLFANVHSNGYFAAAYARAYNDWLIDRWLSVDPRFKGAMMVSPQNIPASVEEIERIGSHPDIVEIVMPSASLMLYGKPYFWPLYEAAAAHGLPIALHPGTEGRGTSVPTASGYPSYYIEWHTMLCTTYMNHMVSMICEGVFAKIPELKLVLIEGGFSWAAPIIWRLDKNWKGLRSEVPWLDRAPSEYMLENVRFTTQPIEEPPKDEYLLQIFEMLQAERILMYSSDYPHWDFDDPVHAFPKLPNDLRDRILYQNAQELYGLELKATPAEATR